MKKLEILVGNDFDYLCKQFNNFETHRQRDTAFNGENPTPSAELGGWRPLEGVSCLRFFFSFNDYFVEPNVFGRELACGTPTGGLRNCLNSNRYGDSS